MARFSKINTGLDRMMARMDELGDDAIQAMRNTPEAKARQAAMRAKIHAATQRAEARRAENKAKSVELASTFSVGQRVRHLRGMVEEATVAQIDGNILTLDNGRKFAATAFVAA